MKWVDALNASLDHIEANLDGEIDYEALARSTFPPSTSAA